MPKTENNRIIVEEGETEEQEEVMRVTLFDRAGNELVRIEGFADDETWYIYPSANSSTRRLIQAKDRDGKTDAEESFQPFPLSGIVVESKDTERPEG